MLYCILADFVVVLHLVFVLFVVCGGILVLRWRPALWVHLPSAVWGIWIEVAGWTCPLTPLENWLRDMGEEVGYTSGFVEHYLLSILYPAGLTRNLQMALGFTALAVNVVVYWRIFSRARGVSVPRRTLSLFALGLVSLLILTWAWGTQLLLSRSDVNSTLTIEPTRLARHVRMLSETFFPRDAGHPENLDRAASYIRQEFAQARGNVAEQPYTVSGNIYRNVTARFGPDTKERLVVGAHYDTAGEQPGADDNASGVAGLIELAHVLGNTVLPVCVELVAFTLEESASFRTNQMGSAVHAQSLKQQGILVRVMFSLEMIGYFTEAPQSQSFPFSVLAVFYPTQGNFIAVVGKLDQGFVVRRVKQAMRGASPLPVYSLTAPRFIPGIDFSDHRSYWDAGYDAVMITDTAFYRNKNYHTVQDTPDTLDYQRMALVIQGVYAAVLALARE